MTRSNLTEKLKTRYTSLETPPYPPLSLSLSLLSLSLSLSVKHILIECRTFAVIKKRLFKVNNLTDLFENVKINDILSFLRETELYQKYDNLKLVNLVQTNEILLIENSTYLNIRFEIFGWICMYI